jgi:hypothetical protein
VAGDARYRRIASRASEVEEGDIWSCEWRSREGSEIASLGISTLRISEGGTPSGWRRELRTHDRAKSRQRREKVSEADTSDLGDSRGY